MISEPAMEPDSVWWIDTDPGVDDAWAILMMLAAPVRVLGLGVVGGNVGIEHTLANACQLADRAPYPLPVYPGCARPIIGGLPDAGHVHGSDGFGDARLPAARSPVQASHAVQALLDASYRHAGALNVLALGPLTNLALALRLDPALPQRCSRLVVMGGAIDGRGNTRAPSAEFNFAYDPEAAAIVLQEWPDVELVDWSLACALAPETAAVEIWLDGPGEHAAWLRSISRQTSAFVRSRQAQHWAWADPLAALVALRPECVSLWTRAPVQIALAPGCTRGSLVIDWHGLGGFTGPQQRLARAIDGVAFHAALRAVL